MMTYQRWVTKTIATVFALLLFSSYTSDAVAATTTTVASSVVQALTDPSLQWRLSFTESSNPNKEGEGFAPIVLRLDGDSVVYFTTPDGQYIVSFEESVKRGGGSHRRALKRGIVSITQASDDTSLMIFEYTVDAEGARHDRDVESLVFANSLRDKESIGKALLSDTDDEQMSRRLVMDVRMRSETQIIGDTQWVFEAVDLRKQAKHASQAVAASTVWSRWLYPISVFGGVYAMLMVAVKWQHSWSGVKKNG